MAKTSKITKKAEPVKRPTNATSIKIGDRIKAQLEKNNKNIEWLAEQIGLKNKASLYTAIKRGSPSIEMLERIASVLQVDIYYFFESEIIERLTEEAAKHQQNPDLKSFLMGFSRDVAKGMPLADAAHKNIDPPGYNLSLVM